MRAAYAASDFEWDSLRRLAVDGTAAANVSLMRDLAAGAMAAGDATRPPEAGGRG